TVSLMPPIYVKPYVKRQKNDMADPEAICEAVTRANMRFVPTKTPEQQSGFVLHRTRQPLIPHQTPAINAFPAHLAEFGITAPIGCGVSRNCYVSLPIPARSGCPSLCAPALWLSAANCSASKSRSWNLIE